MNPRTSSTPTEPKTTRASISFPSSVYEELTRIAAAKKVSVAWVVRDAAERYIAEQWPLFGQANEEARR
jgi:metal-responsive CopG/Arc/MetJ family transcriptional regulator